MSPTLQFQRSLTANLAYWQKRTQNLTDEALTALVEERQNLYRAIEFGLYLSETWHETAVLALQCFAFIERQGYWHEWIPFLEQLQAASDSSTLALKGRLLNHLGIFYRYNRQLDKSLAAHWQEDQIGRSLADSWRIAHAHINLAATCRTLHHVDEAEQHALIARDHFHASKAPTIKLAFVALEFGLIAQARGQWDKAEMHQRQAISLWREIKQPTLLADSLKMLGQVLHRQGNIDAARQVYQETLAILAETGNELDKSRLFIDLGSLHFDEGEWDQAEACLRQADSPALRQSGSLFDHAMIHNNLGNVYMASGRLGDATGHLQQAIALWQQVDDPVQLANSLGTLAEVYLARGEVAAAQPLLQRAIRLLADYPDDAWGQQLREKYARILDETSS